MTASAATLPGTAPEMVPTIWAALLLRFRAAGARLRTVLAPPPVNIAPLEAAVTRLYEALEDLRGRIEELEARNRVSTPPDRALNLTLTSRGMILKLARQGQKPEQIARLLSIPRGEVLLLLRLQQIQVQPSASSEPGTGVGAERIAVVPRVEEAVKKTGALRAGYDASVASRGSQACPQDFFTAPEEARVGA